MDRVEVQLRDIESGMLDEKQKIISYFDDLKAACLAELERLTIESSEKVLEYKKELEKGAASHSVPIPLKTVFLPPVLSASSMFEPTKACLKKSTAVVRDDKLIVQARDGEGKALKKTHHDDTSSRLAGAR